MSYFFVFLFALLAGFFVAGGLLASRLIAPHQVGKIKNKPYECGEIPVGPAWIQFNVGYYLLGLLFLVFDVEAAFLFPWAVAFREVGLVGFIEVLIFIIVLIIGLVYAWRKGALEWV
ncbi:MAG: NAD(P)H-quinone oxidoreductase subunit 3 [Gammaproteobacteria bacterium]|nr:MAG: NAD(P)H-quinone oxidoreductase subunit 3 [Gammaproteobacteria bacterium]